jgi:LytTr DNA-binding domain-containing protein
MFEFLKLKSHDTKRTNSDAQPTQPEPPRFMARLKTDIGPCVWAVSEDDHFIKVYGEKGEDRILYRFSDAVHDLREFKGTRVDLDHWVLQDAIEKVEPVGNTFEVVIKSGKRFSVSDSYRSILLESHWVEQEQNS